MSLALYVCQWVGSRPVACSALPDCRPGGRIISIEGITVNFHHFCMDRAFSPSRLYFMTVAITLFTAWNRRFGERPRACHGRCLSILICESVPGSAWSARRYHIGQTDANERFPYSNSGRTRDQYCPVRIPDQLPLGDVASAALRRDGCGSQGLLKGHLRAGDGNLGAHGKI